MTPELLTTMLTDNAAFTLSDGVATAAEGVVVDLLLEAKNGPAPLHRVSTLALSKAYISVVADDATYCLPYTVVLGLKITPRGDGAGSRAGFRR